MTELETMAKSDVDEGNVDEVTEEDVTAGQNGELTKMLESHETEDRDKYRIDKKDIIEIENGLSVENGLLKAATSINDENIKAAKHHAWKNLMIMSFSFMLSFSAFNSFSNLQSSINIEDGLGTTGLSLIYSTMVFTNLFITPLTASRFGHKRIMVVCMSSYIVFVATGFYSTWATVIPASVVIGLGK